MLGGGAFERGHSALSESSIKSKFRNADQKLSHRHSMLSSEKNPKIIGFSTKFLYKTKP